MVQIPPRHPLLLLRVRANPGPTFESKPPSLVQSSNC
ncbi:uncharacterized protein G2W53_000723 [Senna tora]|uniref:Uncharacterized protein n=1 Tax=Senna tora TaxID=362788 RepID=A0A834XEM4_9FABA|nr:uncharacterized protein G2W53_000723 [Senna tora]